MPFTEKDGHLIKSLRVSKGYGASRLCNMFLERHRNVNGVKTLVKKLTLVEVSTDNQVMVARAVHARLPVSVKLRSCTEPRR